MVEEDIDLFRFFELATSNNLYVNKLNLHEVKNEILLAYKGDFELNGFIFIGPIEYKTKIRFKFMDEVESSINAIDIDYDSEDVTFTGYIYTINTPHFSRVKRSQYGRGTNYMKEVFEFQGQNCYIPTSGNCFIKCNIYSTGKDYAKEFLNLIPTEKRRSSVITSA